MWSGPRRTSQAALRGSASQRSSTFLISPLDHSQCPVGSHCLRHSNEIVAAYQTAAKEKHQVRQYISPSLGSRMWPSYRSAVVDCCPEGFIRELQWRGEQSQNDLDHEMLVQTLHEQMEEQAEDASKENERLLSTLTKNSVKIAILQHKLQQSELERKHEQELKLKANEKVKKLEQCIDELLESKKGFRRATQQRALELENMQTQLEALGVLLEAERSQNLNKVSDLERSLRQTQRKLDCSVLLEKQWGNRFHSLQVTHSTASHRLQQRVEVLEMMLRETRHIKPSAKPGKRRKQEAKVKATITDTSSEMRAMRDTITALQAQISLLNGVHGNKTKSLKLDAIDDEADQSHHEPNENVDKKQNHAVVKNVDAERDDEEKSLKMSQDSLKKWAHFEYDTARLEEHVKVSSESNAIYTSDSFDPVFT